MIGALIRTVRRAEPSVASYVLRVLPIIIIPALIISGLLAYIVSALGVDAGYDDILSEEIPGLSPLMMTIFTAVSVVILAPVIETLMMAAVFWGLRKMKLPYWGLVVGQVAFWIALHSLQVPIWGIGIAWAFFIFSIAYLAWDEKGGMGQAFGVVTLLHALNNLFFFGLTLLPEMAT